MLKAGAPAAAADIATDVSARLRHVLSVHLDPRGGSRYWLERQQRLGMDLRREIRSPDDLTRLEPMSPLELTRRPLLDFVPRALHVRRQEWLPVQTGGATGTPAWTVYSPEEFRAAFVAPFAAAAGHVGFPRGGLWLYAGPSGPHVIGRAARELARVCGAPEPFSIDFDPRWARKLPDGSFAQQRYLQHVVDQTLDVLRSHEIEVLFTTPPLLSALAPRMSETQRLRVRGVHYGGTRLSAAQLAKFQREVFPAATHLAGYGNTLFGCCLELEVGVDRVPCYFPHGERLLLRVVESEATPPPRGTVMFSRLDETVLLINVRERDAGEQVPPPANAPPGFRLAGIRDPGPGAAPDVPPCGLY